MNPVLARELRVRMRGRRSWIVLTLYLLVLAGILFLAFTAQSETGTDNPFDGLSPTRFASVGRSIFEWIILFMLLLVLFLVPGFSAGAIAGERERQTLVPLQVTLLRPWQIVVGKLAASFAFLALLVVAAAPFLGVAYLIGGVTIETVLRGVAVVLFTGVIVGAISLGCSALFRRVQIATVVSYAVVLLMLIGTGIAYGAAAVIDDSRGSDEANPPRALLSPNPVMLAADLLAGDDAPSGVALPLNGLDDFFDRNEQREVPQPLVTEDIAVARGVEVDFGGFQVGPVDEFGNPIGLAQDDRFPFWALSAIVLYSLAVASGVLAVRRLRTPAGNER